mgnify:CR=1 FL=1
MVLANHSPSSPSRPPMEHLYFTTRDSEGEEIHFCTHGFGALYAVHAWLEEILDPHPDIKENWLDDTTVRLEHKSGYTLTIKGSDPQTAIEYEPTKAEKQWTIPYPDSRTVEKLTTFWTRIKPSSHMTTSGSDDKPTNSSAPTRAPAPKRHKSQKPAPSDSITVAMICEELNLAPNKGRNLLRKAKITKPKHGWTFKKDDPALATIRSVLEAG